MRRFLLLPLAMIFATNAAFAAAIIPNGRYESSCYDGEHGYTQEAWVFQEERGATRFFHQTSVYLDAACSRIDSTNAPAGNYSLRALDSGLFELDLAIVRPEGLPKIYTIVRLEGGTLYLGMLSGDQDGSAPDRRPTDVDTSRPFVFAP